MVTFGLGALVFWRYQREMKTIAFQVISQPGARIAVSEPRVAQPMATQAKVKRVSGISRKAVQSASSAVEVKQGNTIAKEADNEVLREDDPDALPDVVDEFLVQQMPALASEVRIPYPSEAKKNGIQGTVVLDILIDSLGQVRDVILVNGPGYGLNEAAFTAVRGFRFHPATSQEGKPVAVRIRYGYRFVLER